MGQLVDGVWHDVWYETKKSGGKFVRQSSQFRNWVTADGAPGPTGSDGFAAEPDRYHLYVSFACPWAHRTLIVRKLKKLESLIGVTVVDWFMGSNGWTFSDRDGATPDTLNGTERLWEVYVKANPSYNGRVTVPILWDKKQQTIVSNESSEIIRMFNTAFDQWGDAAVDLYPDHLRAAIDAINEPIYHKVNNGVYKCGFATSQAAYDAAFADLFAMLDEIEQRLEGQRYLVGDQITEADWRLFTTLVRFDPVYVGHFKCNRQRIADYPNIYNYLKELYQVPGIAETVNFLHIKNHYYGSHETINPTRIVPNGPIIALDAPHDRGRLKAAA